MVTATVGLRVLYKLLKDPRTLKRRWTKQIAPTWDETRHTITTGAGVADESLVCGPDETLSSLKWRTTLNEAGQRNQIKNSLFSTHNRQNCPSTKAVFCGEPESLSHPKVKTLFLKNSMKVIPAWIEQKDWPECMSGGWVWTMTLNSQCDSGQQQQPHPPTSPLQLWNWPSRRWVRLHMDFAGLVQGKTILIVIDSHSKWIEAFPTHIKHRHQVRQNPLLAVWASGSDRYW